MADDLEWIRRARSRDAEAWRFLYATHSFAVRRVCAAFASFSAADVEDVVQDSFVRAFRGIDALREDAAFRPWILSIARTGCLKRLARTQAELQTAKAYVADPSVRFSVELEEELAREKRIALVRAMIEALPAGEQRETVRLFYVDGTMSASDIAARLGVGKSTVTMRLERFRAQLKRRLAAQLARLEEQEV